MHFVFKQVFSISGMKLSFMYAHKQDWKLRNMNTLYWKSGNFQFSLKSNEKYGSLLLNSFKRESESLSLIFRTKLEFLVSRTEMHEWGMFKYLRLI